MNQGSRDSLSCRTRGGWSPCERQMRCTEETLIRTNPAIAAAVQCVVSPGGSLCVSATTRSPMAGGSGGTREGRVLSCNRPSTPVCMNRSCQRHRQVLLLAVCRMISLVPRPSAVNSTIRARHTCFWGLFRSATIASRRARSAAFTSTVIPVRIPQTRMTATTPESSLGLFRQILSTSCGLANSVDRGAGRLDFASAVIDQAEAVDHVGARGRRRQGAGEALPEARLGRGGDCQEFRARLSGLTDQSMARVKRSPKRTANCALAIHHSRGGMSHSFSARFETRESNFIAASSLGKWPLALTALRCLELSASIAFVAYKLRRTSTGNA